MLTTDEIHKKEPVKQRPKEASGFEIKPKAAVPRASFMRSKSELHKPLMEMQDGIKVSEIFSYRKNEIKVGCKFVTLLECFQDQVLAKTKELEETEKEVKISQT